MPGSPHPERTLPGRPLPPQVTMGLLGYLTTHPYDEDYQTVASRRGVTSAPRRSVATRGVIAGIVLLGFALLVVTAGTQTSRQSVAFSDERKDLIAQIHQRNAALRRDEQRTQSLRTDNRRLSREMLTEEADARAMLGRIRQLSAAVGATAVHGPGARVVVDDAPDAARNPRDQVLDSDLQSLVNGLWGAGAEAIAINGQRLTALSSIRKAGSAITVNYHSLSRPYVVEAIGDPDTLPARFAETPDGQAWFDLRQQVGLRFQIHARQLLTLPPARTDLHQARPVQGGNS